MPVEFIGMIGAKHGSETESGAGPAIDPATCGDFARAHEEPASTGSSSATAPRSPTACRSPRTRRTTPSGSAFLIAHRPGFVAPTLAARAFATLDQFDAAAASPCTSSPAATTPSSAATATPDQGRALRAHGRVPPDPRPGLDGRTEPFDFDGRYYRVRGLRQRGPPVPAAAHPAVTSAAPRRRRTDVGARTPTCSRSGASRWRRPPSRSPRCAPPRRPRAAPSRRASACPSARSWATRTRRRGSARTASSRIAEANLDVARAIGKRFGLADGAPENAGSQRLLAAAERGELHDRALWTPIAKAVGAYGNTTALVGIARDRRAGAAGLRRHRRHHAAHPRVRPAGGRRRLRTAPAPARAAGGRTPGLGRSRVGHSLRA